MAKDVMTLPEEIRPGLFRLEIPLPNNPLRTLNSYVITGPERNLVVDTGFNRPECLAAMRAGLRELAIDLAKTDFFITHLHADHSGLAATLATGTSRVMCSAADAQIINRIVALTPSDPYWDDVLSFARRNGFPAAEAEEAVLRHPGYRLVPERQIDFTTVAAGDRVPVGRYNFTCLATPGHTAGHMCLYEPAEKILLAGDHLLRDITPNISHWRPTGNPLADYLASLAKVTDLDVKTVLPGHRRLFDDCRARARELVAHHHRRAAEVAGLLAAGPLTAYQIAGGMKWDMTYRRWDDFPPPQKWFAVGEAIAHLCFLEGRGEIGRSERDGLIMYR